MSMHVNMLWNLLCEQLVNVIMIQLCMFCVLYQKAVVTHVCDPIVVCLKIGYHTKNSWLIIGHIFGGPSAAIPHFLGQIQASSLFHLESLRKLNFCMQSCLRYNSESMRSLLWDGICGSWYPKIWVPYPNSLVLENIWKYIMFPIKVAMFGNVKFS